MVIGGYRWLYVVNIVICSYTWLLVVVHGYGWLFMVMDGYTWLNVVIVGYTCGYGWL